MNTVLLSFCKIGKMQFYHNGANGYIIKVLQMWIRYTWPYTGEMWLNTTGRYVNVYSCSRDESFIYLLYETLKSIHSENLLMEAKEDIKFRIDLFQSIAVRHSHRRGILEVILRNIMYLKPM